MGQFIIIAGGHPFVVLRYHSLMLFFYLCLTFLSFLFQGASTGGSIGRRRSTLWLVAASRWQANKQGGEEKLAWKANQWTLLFLAKNPSQKTNREPTIEPSVKHRRPWGLTTSNILSPHELQVRTQIVWFCMHYYILSNNSGILYDWNMIGFQYDWIPI